MEKEFWPLSQEKAAELRPREKMAMAPNYASRSQAELEEVEGEIRKHGGGERDPDSLACAHSSEETA
jgi:hypothetical protein